MTGFNSQTLTDGLCGFFGDNIIVWEQDREYRVALPLVDEFNDHIELGVWEVDGRWVATDLGFVHREVALKSASEDVEAPVWEAVRSVVNRLDLQWGGGQVWITAESLPELAPAVVRMADAISGSLAAASHFVSDVQVRFWEEVKIFLEDRQIEFERNRRFVGASQVSHRVDFTLVNGQPHLIQAIASESSMRRSLNIFYDILDTPQRVAPVAFIDDSKDTYSNETFEQLSYKSDIYFWKQRDRFTEYWFSQT